MPSKCLLKKTSHTQAETQAVACDPTNKLLGVFNTCMETCEYLEVKRGPVAGAACSGLRVRARTRLVAFVRRALRRRSASASL